MIILIGVPVFIRIFGAICAKANRKALFCAAFGFSVFAIIGLGSFGGLIGADSARYSLLSTMIGAVQFDALGGIDASPAFLFIMKICSVFSTESFVFPLVIAVIQALLAGYAVYTRCDEPYSGAGVLIFCFIPAYFAGSPAFTAALIALIASRCIEERRFFRFAVLMLAAALFDMSALILIPIYFIFLIPNVYISAGASAMLAALAALFPDAVTGVFGFLGSGKCTSAEFPVPCAVIACVAALIGVLMYAMFRNRHNDCEKLVPVLLCGAALSVASVFEPRLFALTQMLLMMSAPVLASEAFTIGVKFVEILFPENKSTSRIVFLAVCVLAEAGICAYLVIGNVFGAAVYDSAFLSGVNL